MNRCDGLDGVLSLLQIQAVNEIYALKAKRVKLKILCHLIHN
jgi:hypothetical protein